ncbi:hypothetical protein C6988_03890 [Nitrosopumilus sp. b1]|uniref:hypothetical protein n=1 Tax=Nitrosopumilus sp. b1 TaxID=2109907 RepID=UPI0015F59B54|nr:hypothetical protein [Nitrosopumilus sp. b1]KAF6243393.1 hypothetical protein C6988_03890 [Nitrosopumilus sp. b1]
MKKMGLGALSDIQQKIKSAKSDLKEIIDLSQPLPELITSANLIRANEHLTKTNSKQSELITYYDAYTQHLETLLETVFEIQDDLKNLLREQSKLIEKTPKKAKRTRK